MSDESTPTAALPARPVRVARFNELEDRQPAAALVAGVDLVIVRYDDQVSVFYGRCLHRGALLADGHVSGHNLICGLHGWDFRVDTGVSEYDNSEALPAFRSWVDAGTDEVTVDEAQVEAWARDNPQPYDRERYLGAYADLHGTPEEPDNAYIQELSRNGLEKLGHHGRVTAMGVPIPELPNWSDIQVLTAQLARAPLFDEDPVDTKLVIGPNAKRPLELEIPLFVSDMSFGALSREAKDRALHGRGVGIGHGNLLRRRRNAAGRAASGERLTISTNWPRGGSAGAWTSVKRCARRSISRAGRERRQEPAGTCRGTRSRRRSPKYAGSKWASPPSAPRTSPTSRRRRTSRASQTKCAKPREASPSGFKLSAQHVEADIDFALEAGADYIILDGRGGGTGAAPTVLKDNISVPSIAALARARRQLDARGAGGVTLIATGGLRTESDFVKALALGADGIAVSNSALQGDRVHCDARLSHEQLPRGYRNAEPGPSAHGSSSSAPPSSSRTTSMRR